VKTARDVGLLFDRYLTQLLRNPVWVIVGFSTPILYLALFTPLLKQLAGAPGLPGGNVLAEFLPGILSLLAFASGIGPGFNTIFELRSGVIERFRVTPASRFAILVGPILATMVMMFVFDAAVVAVGAGFGFRLHWLGLAELTVLLGLLMVTVAACSIAVALVTKDISGFAAIVNGLNLPVLLLAGVLLPISLGPLWMRVLAHFNPLYYLVTASRVVASGTLSGTTVWQAFAVLAPVCAVTLFWATRVVRRAVA
jgi:ABC-2 type transport system permease protein